MEDIVPKRTPEQLWNFTNFTKKKSTSNTKTSPKIKKINFVDKN